MRQIFGKRGLMRPLPRPARKWVVSTAKGLSRRPGGGNFAWRVTGACLLILSGLCMVFTGIDLKQKTASACVFLAGLFGIYFGLQQLTRLFLKTRKSEQRDSGSGGSGGDGWIGSSDAGGCGRMRR